MIKSYLKTHTIPIPFVFRPIQKKETEVLTSAPKHIGSTTISLSEPPFYRVSYDVRGRFKKSSLMKHLFKLVFPFRHEGTTFGTGGDCSKNPAHFE